jgi:hypothetical protein
MKTGCEKSPGTVPLNFVQEFNIYVNNTSAAESKFSKKILMFSFSQGMNHIRMRK